MRQHSRITSSLLVVSCFASPSAAAFVNFESQHVHPIALSADGTRLFAVNTPDNRLAVFTVSAGGLSLDFEVPVGLDPVSIAVADANHVWVANHLSDTVSIVDLAARNVVATLSVGDEPADIVFAGTPRRAFISVSQEDAIKIYDPANQSAAPVVVPLFGSDPQALAASPDGSKVYAAIFDSGNQTTIAGESDVVVHGGLPPPNPPGRPNTGLVLEWRNNRWEDELGRNYSNSHPYTLPDHDVAVLDANSPVPVPTYVDNLGTLMFNIGVHPLTGHVYVTNTDALNHIRFEPALRGSFLRTRVSIVDPVAPAAPALVDLNTHIDYGVTPGPQAEIDQSLSQPGGFAFASTGGTIYVTALGSAKVAVLNDAGAVVARIGVGEGPSGLVLDETLDRLYVLNRFDNTISTVDTQSRLLESTLSLFDPSPAVIRNGRKFLYDGRLSSGHGDLACASCHAGGNLDNIAWDLGDPNGTPQPPPPGQLDPLLTNFHPMKGPMTTQSLRGLSGTEPFHWRGDRSGFTAFNPAFVGLMGRGTQLSTSDMQAFEDFILTLQYPPNPNQNLDRSFPNPATGASAERGRQLFVGPTLDGPFRCSDCHSLPTGTNGQIINRFALQESQDIKVPQLRNMYEKTGFDGAPGEKKRGFGFIHDGSSPTLFDFLHFPGFEFQNDGERRDMEAFLHAFDTGMAPAVGAQRTVDATNRNSAAFTTWLQTMRNQDALGNCDLVVKGLRGGIPRGWLYAGNDLFRSDHSGEPMLTTAALLALTDEGTALTFTGVPPASGERIGIDRDEDGFGDQTEIGAGSDPTDPNSVPEVTAVGPSTGSVGGDRLASWPNPTSAARGATISFGLAARGPVDARLFDANGRHVVTLFKGVTGPGEVQLHWDGTDRRGKRVASGVYFYRVESAGRRRSNSLLVMP